MAVAFFSGTKAGESMKRLMIIMMVCLSVSGLAGCKAHKNSKAEDDEAANIALWITISNTMNSITSSTSHPTTTDDSATTAHEDVATTEEPATTTEAIP